MEQLYFCFDIGGTYIKAAIINKANQILYKLKANTQKALKLKPLANVLFSLIKYAQKKSSINLSNLYGIGIGVPGWIDSQNGQIVFSPNMNLKNYPLKTELEILTNNSNIKVFNDAFVATLAEKTLGNGAKYDDFVMLTLGTGVGGGVVLNGQMRAHSCEIGHMNISTSTKLCNCGEIGCFETVASTNALIKLAKEKMKQSSNCALWQFCTPDTINGKIIFDCSDDPVVKQVLQEYIQNVGGGIVGICNMLDPQAIIIGGAISAQKEKVIIPLENYINQHTMARFVGKKISVVQAKVTNDTGILGARQLFELDE